MFTRKKTEKSKLDEALDEVFAELKATTADTPEYAKAVKQLTKLYKLKEIDSKKRVSPDTLALIAANLGGIAIIVGYERANIMTSKALGFIRQLR